MVPRCRVRSLTLRAKVKTGENTCFFGITDLGRKKIHNIKTRSEFGSMSQHRHWGLGLLQCQHPLPHLPGMTDGNVGHELDTAGDANVVNSGIHETKTRCDGLVRRDASHGDGVSGYAVRKSGAEGSLSGYVGCFDFLVSRF